MSQYSLSFTSILLFFAITTVGIITAMKPKLHDQSKKLFIEFRNLPSELQQQISLCREDIIFLWQQPTILAGISTSPVSIHNDTVLTGSYDNNIVVWDINTGKFIRNVDERSNIWSRMRPDYDSMIVIDDTVIVALLNRTTQIWNINANTLLKTLTRENRPACGFSSIAIHNTTAVIGSYDGTTEIWDINTSERVHILAGHTDRVWSVATDGNIVATGSHDSTAKIWNIHTGELLHTLIIEKEKNKEVRSIALHNDTVITGLWDGTIRIWNKHTGKFLGTLESPNRHTQRITAMAIQDDILVTGSWDNTAKIWNLHTRKLLRTLANPSRHNKNVLPTIESIAMNNEAVITGSSGCTAIWPLSPNLKGILKDNPLLWIIHKTDILQLDLIQRACEATIADQNFIIDLPKKLGKIDDDESQEQMDGRTYFTLPCAVREYLRTRLNIKPLLD